MQTLMWNKKNQLGNQYRMGKKSIAYPTNGCNRNDDGNDDEKKEKKIRTRNKAVRIL